MKKTVKLEGVCLSFSFLQVAFSTFPKAGLFGKVAIDKGRYQPRSQCNRPAPNAGGEPPRHVLTAAWVKATIGAVGSSALLGWLRRFTAVQPEGTAQCFRVASAPVLGAVPWKALPQGRCAPAAQCRRSCGWAFLSWRHGLCLFILA